MKHFIKVRINTLGPYFLILAILWAYLFLACQKDLRFTVTTVVLVSAVIMCMLAFILYFENEFTVLKSPWLILIVAAAIRLLFVFRPPEFSDDLFRYLFDGLQSFLGHNPYAAAPADADLSENILKVLVRHVNHPHLVTIYPPGAQTVFLLGSHLSLKVFGIKLLLICMDLGTCALVIYLLAFLNLPLKNTILYAWHPLAVLETAGSGHIDAAGIFFFFLSVAIVVKFFTRGKKTGPDLKLQDTRPFELRFFFRCFCAGMFYAFSILIKLFPFFYFPFYYKFLSPGHRYYFLSGAIIGGVLLSVPFLPDLLHMADTLFIYSRHWEFSGLLYRSFSALNLSGDLSRLLLMSGFLFAMVLLVIYPTWLPEPDFFTGEPRPIERFFCQMYFITLAFMFFTPTLHPWYALYLAVLLPFLPNVFGIILSWSVLLSYRVLILYSYSGQWIESDLIPVLIWSGPLMAFVLNRMAREKQHFPGNTS